MLGKMDYCHSYRLKKRKGGVWGWPSATEKAASRISAVNYWNASAQFNLGMIYGLGKGVLKDYVYAYMWGNIAASNGNESGAKLRDDFEKKMTPADISTAQRLARECVRNKYKVC